jgi:predicted DNA-binding protein
MSKVAQAKVSDEMYEKIEALADRLKSTPSAVIRAFLEAGLEKNPVDELELARWRKKKASTNKASISIGPGGQLKAILTIETSKPVNGEVKARRKGPAHSESRRTEGDLQIACSSIRKLPATPETARNKPKLEAA